MNFAICFVLLALAACAHSAPLPEETKYSTNKMFEGDMNDIQGALLDIQTAGQDLQTEEGMLEQVVAKKADFEAAEKTLEAAVTNVYQNEWKPKDGQPTN